MRIEIAESRCSSRSIFIFLILSVLFSPVSAHAVESLTFSDREKDLVDKGEIVVRDLGVTEKGGRTLEAIGRINASRKIVFQVLREYKKYPEFMPNVSRIEVIEQKKDSSVLNYTLSLPMGNIKKYRLAMTESNKNKNTSFLHWKLLEWPGLKEKETIKDANGYWLIRTITEDSSYVLYHTYTDPGPIPFGLGWIADIMTKNSIPEMMLNTKSRAEKLRNTDTF